MPKYSYFQTFIAHFVCNYKIYSTFAQVFTIVHAHTTLMKQEFNWKLGEVVSLSRKTKTIKKSGVTSYGYIHSSRYVCIREATDREAGILVKVMGRYSTQDIRIVGGQPFCKDDHDELFESNSYLTFPFPTADELREALGIIDANPDVMQGFRQASMHLNLQGKLWVRDTERRLLVMRKALCLDAPSGLVAPPSPNDEPYRLTLAFFDSEHKILW